MIRNSVSRRASSFLLRNASAGLRGLFHRYGPLLKLYEDLLPSSSRKAGDGIGVEVPESTSLRPRKPFRNLLGAGRPLRKCSSSASVPLSLLGVISLEVLGRTDCVLVGFVSEDLYGK